MPLSERQMPNCALAVAAQAMVEACATMDVASQTLLCSLDGAHKAIRRQGRRCVRTAHALSPTAASAEGCRIGTSGRGLAAVHSARAGGVLDVVDT